METFRAFSALHAVALLALAALTLAAILAARRRPRPAAERAVALGFLAAWLTTYAFLQFPPLSDPATTLPLHLCHLAALTAPFVLLTGWRPLRAIQYFWGLALCTQAVITPSLTEGPALYPFWFFWAYHGMAVGVPLYDVFGRGYRPTWRDYGTACAAAAAYVAIVLPLDLAFGWNYGFLGPSRPEVRSIVDFLGPWPERLLPIVLIVAAAMAAAQLPWTIARRLRRR